MYLALLIQPGFNHIRPCSYAVTVPNGKCNLAKRLQCAQKVLITSVVPVKSKIRSPSAELSTLSKIEQGSQLSIIRAKKACASSAM